MVLVGVGPVLNPIMRYRIETRQELLPCAFQVENSLCKEDADGEWQGGSIRIRKA